MASSVVTLRLPTETERELTERARERNTTRGELARAIVGDWLASHEPGAAGVPLTVRFPTEEADRLRQDAARWNLEPAEVIRRYVSVGRSAHAARAKAEAERATASRPATP